MASNTGLARKLNKLNVEVAELAKRVEVLEALLEMELARGHMAAEKAPMSLPATKRRPRKKAS